MSGLEVAIPLLLELVPILLRLGKALVEVGEELHEDIRPFNSLVAQVDHDIDRAEYLYSSSKALLREHVGLGGWIYGMIKNAKDALKEYKDHIPKKDEKHATMKALTRKLHHQKNCEEWGKTLRASHSSILTAITVMHQLEPLKSVGEVSQEREVPRASSLPPYATALALALPSSVPKPVDEK
ncbi:hypothetical protein NW762_006729 [Fusarium torreyae]|uniref:NACHT-NTPase and P-loop NTPases N-terminal domain-containing protein n=1 Tax=Fusarium torreyae TaxID=1237075 RepID=A0A9W8S0M2_9HYPO|nr:hypothetical protein NW762_006729 [Fusarium torreyae]